LVDRARLWILVGTKAQELRPVPEALSLPLVVTHLDDELRLDRAPLERDVAPPPARLAARKPFRVLPEKRFHAREDVVAVLAGG
jgi:hypothetical protein